MSHTLDLAIRFWEEMIARPFGPMKFRFVLQPVMASALAIRDGLKDARTERGPYFWTILHDPARRRKKLMGGLRAVLRVLVLGAVMDVIYQLTELHGVRPVQTAVIALQLAFVPYVIVRGPTTRIARYLQRHADQPQSSHGR